MVGKNNDAMLELRRAESLDPLSLIVDADIADTLCVAHRYDAAVEQSEKTLKMDANFAIGHYELGQASRESTCMIRQSQVSKGNRTFWTQRSFHSNLGYTYAVSNKERQ